MNYIEIQSVKYLGEIDNFHNFIVKGIRDGIYYLIKALPKVILDINKLDIVFILFSKQINLLLDSSYQHIIKYYQYCEKEEFYFFVSDYLDSNLIQFYQQFSDINNLLDERIILIIFRDILRGLDLFHENNFIHNNINLNNVFIRYNCICVLGEPLMLFKRNNNVSDYISPEVVDGKDATIESDLYSVGCILYYLCTGKLPFHGISEFNTIKLILEGNYEKINGYSDYLCDIIDKLLSKDPSNRGNVEEYLLELNEKFNNCIE